MNFFFGFLPDVIHIFSVLWVLEAWYSGGSKSQKLCWEVERGIQRVGWVLDAQVMGSGVLGAQVLGANSGVLVFKLWGLCPKCTCQIWLKFCWETKNGSTKFKDLAEGKRTLLSPHGAAWDLPNG